MTALPTPAPTTRSSHYTTTLLLLAIAVIAGAASTSGAVTVDLSLDIEARITSAHLWRGSVVHAQPAFQPSVTLNAGDWMFNVWGTWDMMQAPDTWERARMDGTLEYSWTGDRHIMSGGVIAYVYHDGLLRETRDTFELFVGGAMDIISLPSITVYYDFELVKGFYTSFSLGHTFALHKNMVQLDLGLYVGAASGNYNNYVFGKRIGGGEEEEEEVDLGFSLVDLTATAEVPIYAWENVAIVPGIKFMTLLDSDIAEASLANEQSPFTIAYSIGLLAHF